MIAVEVINILDGSYLENQDMWWFAGIIRRCGVLITRPLVHLSEYKIDALLEEDLSTGNFTGNSLLLKIIHVRDSETYDGRDRICMMERRKFLREEHPVILSGADSDDVEAMSGRKMTVVIDRRFRNTAVTVSRSSVFI